jgi:hypothetical protein
MKQKHRPKPNFLIIGAAKAGTASLTALLKQHPDVGIALGDQPNFFSFDDKYKLGWKKYLRLFEHCVGKKAIGDVSRSYSRIRYHPQVIERIREHIPRARIIYMVRHPLDRMVSAYAERMSYPNPPPFTSVSDAVRKEPMIVDSSRYWEVYNAYRQAFSESQIKVIWFEEYLSKTVEVFQDVCRFLDLDHTVSPDIQRERANPLSDADEREVTISSVGTPLVAEWEPETRNWVIEQIRRDNCRLLEHFGKPIDFWRDLFRVSGPGAL